MNTGLLVLQILLLFIIFGVFIFIGFRLLKKNMLSTTQRLDDLGQDHIRMREEAKKKVEEAQILYQQIIDKGKAEALEMRNDVLNGANQEKESIISKARNQAEDIVRDGEKTRQMLISELEKRIETGAVKRSAEMLKGVLSDDLRLIIHNYLVERLLEEGLKDSKKLVVPGNTEEAKVITALPLQAKERKALSDALKNSLGRDFKITESVDDAVIAGFMIILGSLVFDGTLRLKIDEKVKEILR